MTAGRVLLTGATGFIGRHLALALRQRGYRVRELGRRFSGIGDEFVLADLEHEVNWEQALADSTCIVHCAGLAHVPAHKLDPPALHRLQRVNVEVPAQFAAFAAARAVDRFVFLSTAKVLGEHTDAEEQFDENSRPAPGDPYSRSKLEAEEAIAATATLNWTILRPPLVYGPGVGGNFRKVVDWVRKGFPLPLAGVKNRRSLLSVGKLCEATIACLEQPKAIGQRFLLADAEPISTARLVREIADALGRRPRLIDIPPSVMRGLLGLLGRADAWDKLTLSFAIDNAHIVDRIDWKPEMDLSRAIRHAVLKPA